MAKRGNKGSRGDDLRCLFSGTVSSAVEHLLIYSEKDEKVLQPKQVYTCGRDGVHLTLSICALCKGTCKCARGVGKHL